MKKRNLIAIGTAISVLAIPAVASASVQFDGASGTGFVGKGDVQTAFTWNDSKLQSNAKDMAFKYDKTTAEDYRVVCEWDTETGSIKNPQTVHHVANKSADVDASVAYDAKSASRSNPNGKVTGFNLLGQKNVVETSSGDAIPAVGDACLGQGQGTINPHITSVELESSTTSEKLTATYSVTGESHQLAWPVVEAAPAL